MVRRPLRVNSQKGDGRPRNVGLVLGCVKTPAKTELAPDLQIAFRCPIGNRLLQRPRSDRYKLLDIDVGTKQGPALGSKLT